MKIMLLSLLFTSFLCCEFMCEMCMSVCVMLWWKFMWWNAVFVFAVLNDILLEKMWWFLWKYYVKKMLWNVVMMYVWCSEIYVCDVWGWIIWTGGWGSSLHVNCFCNDGDHWCLFQDLGVTNSDNIGQILVGLLSDPKDGFSTLISFCKWWYQL
jgi:hypothetical protein